MQPSSAVGPSSEISSCCRRLLRRVEALLNLGPVHHAPPRGDIFGAAVLILQIIRVLPDVQAHDRKVAFHHGAVLIGCRNNLDAFAVLDKPGPAGAETPGGRGAELFLECVETAERGVNRARDVAGRAAAGAGSEDGPEHRVIDMPAAVVANRGFDIVGNDGAIIREQLLHGFAL